jgi:hypothetical protein
MQNFEIFVVITYEETNFFFNFKFLECQVDMVRVKFTLEQAMKA